MSLEFGQYIAPCVVAKNDSESSPDMSHLIDVVDGDTLPHLCQEIWKDDSYYIHAAEYNNLNKFRNLKGTNKLIFPPIIQPA